MGPRHPPLPCPQAVVSQDEPRREVARDMLVLLLLPLHVIPWLAKTNREKEERWRAEGGRGKAVGYAHFPLSHFSVRLPSSMWLAKTNYGRRGGEAKGGRAADAGAAPAHPGSFWRKLKGWPCAASRRRLAGCVRWGRATHHCHAHKPWLAKTNHGEKWRGTCLFCYCCHCMLSRG